LIYCYICWVNRIKIGETRDKKNEKRNYFIPSSVLKEGKNTILVRIEDVIGRGGFFGKEDSLYLAMDKDTIPLNGDWEYKIGKFDNEMQVNSLISPKRLQSLIYNKMIHPLTTISIKGVLWYQGEGNTGKKGRKKYEENFKTLIKDWRKTWNIGAFPFFYVQIANYGQPDSIPLESNWAIIREAQLNTLEVPNTGMAVAIDRLSLIARNKEYGEQDLLFSGPTLKNVEQVDNRILLEFDNVGKTLQLRRKKRIGIELKGFAIATDDENFIWANASIVDYNKVMVWSETITHPKYLRYGWSNNPKVNLYNNEGLPASPFRITLK